MAYYPGENWSYRKIIFKITKWNAGGPHNFTSQSFSSPCTCGVLLHALTYCMINQSAEYLINKTNPNILAGNRIWTSSCGHSKTPDAACNSHTNDIIEFHYAITFACLPVADVCLRKWRKRIAVVGWNKLGLPFVRGCHVLASYVY